MDTLSFQDKARMLADAAKCAADGGVRPSKERNVQYPSVLLQAHQGPHKTPRLDAAPLLVR